MAETLFDKAKLLSQATLHHLLDDGIDKMTIPVLKQYIRNLEEASDEHSDALAIADGQVVRLTASVKIIREDIVQVNDDIDLFMSDEIPENDDLIEPLDQKLMGLEDELEKLEPKLVDAKATSQALGMADRQIDKALADRLNAVQEMEIVEKAADATMKSAEALKKVGDLTTFNESVDSISSRINKKTSIANARLKKVLAGFSGSDIDNRVRAEKSRQRIAARRAKLNKQ